MTLTKQGRVEGSAIVFSSPLPLSDGTEVTVQIQTSSDPAAGQPPEAELATMAFIGMWSDREDMLDSGDWVGRQRSQWPDRTTRQD